MKCCFCGEELEYDWYEYENGRGDTEYAKSGLLKCPDWECRGYKLKLEPEIWEALIDGKKARDKLDKVDKMLFSLVLKAHDLTALDLLQGITDIRLKIIKFITKHGEKK